MSHLGKQELNISPDNLGKFVVCSVFKVYSLNLLFLSIVLQEPAAVWFPCLEDGWPTPTRAGST